LGIAIVFNTGENARTKSEIFFQNGNQIDNRADLK
jgi:hypothetical protein